MSPYVRVIAGNRAVGRAINPSVSQPWGPESEVRSMYRSDLRWVNFKILHGQPVIGTAARKPKARDRQRDTELSKSTDMHPEIGWIYTRPPEKDENGIPIPPPYGGKGRRPGAPATRMKINGRWHQWVDGRWVPLARRVRGLTHRYGIPNDLRVPHGPWWPEGRQKVINLQRRIEEKKPAPPTDQQAQDIRDLLEALNA